MEHACVQITLLVGILYSCIGIFQLTFLANFLSHSVISGFTTGAACIIGLSQVKYILGVKMPSRETALKTAIDLVGKLPETQWRELLMGLTWLIALIVVKHVCPSTPSPCVSLSLLIARTFSAAC
jgi:MFS superfamily sulfate permease-like transporter